jgi:Flp pilus assembly protein TadB
VGRRVESERPFQYSGGCSVSKAAKGLESCFHPQGIGWGRRQLSSNDALITVLSPVERLHTGGRQPGKPSTTSVGSPAQKAGLVHLPKKVIVVVVVVIVVVVVVIIVVVVVVVVVVVIVVDFESVLKCRFKCKCKFSIHDQSLFL